MATAADIKKKAAAAKAKTETTSAEKPKRKPGKRSKPFEVLQNLKDRREALVEEFTEKLEKLDNLIAEKEKETVTKDEAVKLVVQAGGTDAIKAQIRRLQAAQRIAEAATPEELAAAEQAAAELETEEATGEAAE